MIYKNELERIRRELEERKADLIQELDNLPEGRLLCFEENGIERYYRRLPAVGNRKKERRIGIKSDPAMIHALVRKEYVTKTLKLIDVDIRAVKLASGRYKALDENSVMEGFIGKHPGLNAMIYREPFDAGKWVQRGKRIDEYHAENLRQIAADGTRMRSKNEVYIASRLDHYGIIYKSDTPTDIPNFMRVPDFTILRKSDHKIIYWEHMGMMDVESYRMENKKKLAEYEAVGIVPWDNLIITYDSVGGGLRANLIEAMIKSWLL